MALCGIVTSAAIPRAPGKEKAEDGGMGDVSSNIALDLSDLRALQGSKKGNPAAVAQGSRSLERWKPARLPPPSPDPLPRPSPAVLYTSLACSMRRTKTRSGWQHRQTSSRAQTLSLERTARSRSSRYCKGARDSGLQTRGGRRGASREWQTFLQSLLSLSSALLTGSSGSSGRMPRASSFTSAQAKARTTASAMTPLAWANQPQDLRKQLGALTRKSPRHIWKPTTRPSETCPSLVPHSLRPRPPLLLPSSRLVHATPNLRDDMCFGLRTFAPCGLLLAFVRSVCGAFDRMTLYSSNRNDLRMAPYSMRKLSIACRRQGQQ